jgi:protein-S-isoprenylcysteine O-methyltransferase Ste14
MNARAQGRIKPGKASLIGGIAVAVASFILWAAVAHELGAATVPWLVVGALVAAGIGTWIRVADL